MEFGMTDENEFPKTTNLRYHVHTFTETTSDEECALKHEDQLPYFAKFESSSLAEGLYGVFHTIGDRVKDILSMKLILTFQTGVRYVYNDVPEGVWEGLLKAESKGAFFSSEIRNKYEYEKISDSDDSKG